MDKLSQFYNDKAMMESVYIHVTAYLQKYALEKVFEGKPTYAIPEALNVLEGAFNELNDIYGPKKAKSKSNPAR